MLKNIIVNISGFILLVCSVFLWANEPTNNSIDLSKIAPFIITSPLKPYKINFAASVTFGITISGIAWEELKKNNKGEWTLTTFAKAWGNSTTDELTFKLGINNEFIPIKFKQVGSDWIEDRIRELTYGHNGNKTKYKYIKGGELENEYDFVAEAGAYDAMSLRFLLGRLAKQKPNLTNIKYKLIYNSEFKEQTAIISKETIETNFGKLATVHVKINPKKDKYINVWLAPTMHHISVKLKLIDGSAKINLNSKDIVLDSQTIKKSAK